MEPPPPPPEPSGPGLRTKGQAGAFCRLTFPAAVPQPDPKAGRLAIFEPAKSGGQPSNFGSTRQSPSLTRPVQRKGTR